MVAFGHFWPDPPHGKLLAKSPLSLIHKGFQRCPGPYLLFGAPNDFYVKGNRAIVERPYSFIRVNSFVQIKVPFYQAFDDLARQSAGSAHGGTRGGAGLRRGDWLDESELYKVCARVSAIRVFAMCPCVHDQGFCIPNSYRFMTVQLGSA